MPTFEELDAAWDRYVQALGHMIVAAGSMEHAVAAIARDFGEIAFEDEDLVTRLEQGRWELSRLCDDIKKWSRTSMRPPELWAEVAEKLRVLLNEAKALGRERNLVVHALWHRPDVFDMKRKVSRTPARGLKTRETPIEEIEDLTRRLKECGDRLSELHLEDIYWALIAD